MSATMKRRAFLSAIAVISAGCLLHFTWEWSGRSTIVAVFSATNESTWEHLKLAFWPALALAPLQRNIYGSYPGWLPATAIRCILPSLLIVALFYGYTALSGSHHLVADVTIFALAIFAGEFLGHAVLTREFGAGSRIGALGLLLLATVLFSTLTFRPPNFFLFRKPRDSQPMHINLAGVPSAPVAVQPELTQLTPDGWGPLRIGMSRDEVVSAAGEDETPAAPGGPDPQQCARSEYVGPDEIDIHASLG